METHLDHKVDIPLTIGIVGCGMVAEGHLKAIAQSPHWRLVGIAERNDVRAQEVTKSFAPPLVTNHYQRLLDLEPDALIVATPVDGHHSIVCDALKRGIHVLCEKPMATSLQECRDMIISSHKANRLLAVNFNTRSGLPYRRIKDLIDQGCIGTVHVIRFVYIWSCHQWQPPQRLEHFMAHGGPIVDSGVHFFDGLRWMSNQPINHIQAVGVRLSPHRHPQHVIATCQIAGGAIGLVETGWLYTKQTKDQGRVFEITAIGDDGTLDYNLDRGTLQVYTADGTDEETLTDFGKHFDVVLDKFALSIKHGRLIGLASAEDGLYATEAAYRALSATST